MLPNRMSVAFQYGNRSLPNNYEHFLWVQIWLFQYHSEIKDYSEYKSIADFQRITRRYSPVERTIHNHRCENLKSYNSDVSPRGFTSAFLLTSCYITSVVGVYLPAIVLLLEGDSEHS
jgi:hypothetical protein